MGKSGKKRVVDSGRTQTPGQSLSEEKLKLQLQTLLRQQNYRQAIDKLKQIHQIYPNATLDTTEAKLWLLKGQQEYTQSRYNLAEASFRTSIELGLQGEAHYWLSKCFLATDQLPAALEVVQTAFEAKTLPKDHAGCYLKLLFLNQHPERVADLISRQANRFFAADLHWAKGVLALQANQPSAAVTHFEAMEKKRAPGGTASVWLAYAHQQNEAWQKAAQELGIEVSPSRFSPRTPLSKPPAVERLWILQAAIQKQPLSRHIPLPASKGSQPLRSLMLVIEYLSFLENKDFHAVGHLLLIAGTDWQYSEYPELEALFRPVMLAAGEQALKHEEPEDTVKFWETIVYQAPFDRELALKLNMIYDALQVVPERQRLLTYIIGYVKNEAQTQPQDWPQTRLDAVLARIYCWVFDTWMMRDQRRQAFKALQEAEQLCAASPEVIGRQGIKAKVQGDRPLAIAKLKESLDKGCDSYALYEALLEVLEQEGDTKALKEARRRYGKSFGDMSVDTEVDIPQWIQALSTQTYWFFQGFLKDQSNQDPALQACRIFSHAVVDMAAGSSGRVGFNHTQAQSEWDRLLSTLPPAEQVPVFQAILITIQMFAKRQKGLADLQKRYQQRLSTLGNEVPEATAAFLVVLALKEKTLKLLQAPLTAYLDQSPQPGNALAGIQLQARSFMHTEVLRPLIENALKREPQNPLLLLAKATTFPFRTSQYKQSHTEGFELARRLQDASALQAYREEEFFQSDRMTKECLPELMNPFGPNMDEIARRMLEKFLGDDVPPEMLDRLLPELLGGLEDDMPDFFFDDDDDDDDFFSFGSPFPQKKKAKKKKRFTDL